VSKPYKVIEKHSDQSMRHIPYVSGPALCTKCRDYNEAQWLAETLNEAYQLGRAAADKELVDLADIIKSLCDECDKATSDLDRAGMGMSAQSLGMTAHAARAFVAAHRKANP
jgi:hypothetical protein